MKLDRIRVITMYAEWYKVGHKKKERKHIR